VIDLVKVCDKAPDFTLRSSTGENITISEFFGKKSLVIFFYPMDESPVCSREAEAFKNKHESFKELKAEVIGISPQTVDSHKSFAKRHKLPFILLSDPQNKVRKLYGVTSTLGVVPGRATFVIGKDSIVKYVFSSQFQPAKHAEKALNALEREDEKLAKSHELI
jgi:thioredoxin-dependent peroxiredoxin